MSDIDTIWTGAHGDYALQGSVLQSGDDLVTAVLLSLFTDRRAEDDDLLLDGSQDRRGWWGDGDVRIGSRLWLIERAKRTQTALQQAQTYIAEALQWLIDDGVVSKWDITVEWPPGSPLEALVVAHRGAADRKAMRFSWAWAERPNFSSGSAQGTGPRILRLDGTWRLDGSELLNGYFAS